MSLGEIGELIKSHNHQLYEKERLQCFFNLLAQGTEVKNPTDIVRFDWEKKPVKEGHKLTEEEKKKKEQRAKKYINHGRR